MSNLNDGEEADRLDYGLGQIHGLIACVMALALAHPDRPALLRYFEAAKTAAGAIPEQQPVSEAFLEGIADVTKRLTNALKSAEKSKEVP